MPRPLPQPELRPAEFLVNDQRLNLQLVAAELAMANVGDSEFCSQDYVEAQKVAYEQRLGIWGRE
ncbi:hypothetical protein VB712_15010 [Spirulina sp. CCNP1310]|uniref:hypothetical protein n=1 Tax=Spirulina sp. CCNP1310 TaxID=3110249 RepID=UPI002B21D8D3|nr:hypothetical protein [Spirulina sp. CCNP1310]MEA5420541.1 hypothetical protein [Spirulina sp. CCNP1310]